MAFIELARDDFHRPNEQPLNPVKWEQYYQSNQQLAVLSQVCVAEAASLSGTQFYIGVSLPSNQFVRIILGSTTSGSEWDLGIRTDDEEDTGYSFSLFAEPTYSIMIQNFSTSATLGTYNLPVPPQTGDEIIFSAVGNIISVYYNKALVLHVKDAMFSSGITGLGISAMAVQVDTSVSLFTTGYVSSPTPGTIFPGVYNGSSLATAFFNPSNFDLMQVINEGGKVVWNLTSTGVANTNPASPTANSILGKFFGSSFATAFVNPNRLDILQVVSEGGHVVFGVDGDGIPYVG